MIDDLKNKIKDMTNTTITPTLEIVSEVFLDGTTGAVVPGVGNAILSYKQNRMERRIEDTLRQLIERQDELNNYIMDLTNEIAVQNIKNMYFEILLYYTITEPQEDKLKYFVNGYINVTQ